MVKNEFKQGDKVKLKEYREFTCDNELTYIDTDEIGVVVQVDGNYLKVNFSDMPTLLTFHFSDMVLAEPQEIKTAFLTRLQSLMREYNAKIECWQSDFESVAMAIIIGDDMVEYNSGDKSNLISVIADNIMDFDKE